MAISNVKCEKFLIFKNIDINFSKGINVIIGENGSGKTQLLKIMYSMQEDEKSRSLTENRFKEYFNVSIEDFNPKGVLVKKDDATSVFIPAKDMLTHSKGLINMAAKHSNDMPFNKCLLDIIVKSGNWKLNSVPSEYLKLLSIIENIIDGKVLIEDDTFYIEKSNGLKVNFELEAEGFKKIALIWQLIITDNINNGSVLFWDEPEANLNPKIFKLVAEILVELSRLGTQIFIATHNYNLATYIDLLIKDSDDISYISLYKDNDEIKSEISNKFSLLKNNPIRDANINLYDDNIMKEI